MRTVKLKESAMACWGVPVDRWSYMVSRKGNNIYLCSTMYKEKSISMHSDTAYNPIIGLRHHPLVNRSCYD